MRDTVNLRDVTDRVLGLVPRRQPARVTQRWPGDKLIARILLAISAVCTIVCLTLWATGHSDAALRLLGGTILVLVLLIRLR